VGLNINVEKSKATVQSGRPGSRRTLTVENHDIEVVTRFKYQETVLNDTNEEKEEIQARILAANKAYSSLQTIFRSKQTTFRYKQTTFRSKQIQRNNKIRLYKTLIKPTLSYESVT
jgi:hypothetical protein